jgi:P4 family phage/plasmid primase-like protien
MTDCLNAGLTHLDAGRPVVPCNGKVPVGNDWGGTRWRDPEALKAHFAEHSDHNLGLIFDGRLIDIEADDAEQEAVFRELFEGCDVPRTPCFASPRGKHFIFKGDARLTALEVGVLNFKGLGVRIGAGGKQVQSVIPPSENPDGTRREWTVSFDDCEAAELPEIVVQRILDSIKPQAKPMLVATAPGTISKAVAAMLGKSMEDQEDGSKRLYAYACSAVEHDLNDVDAIAAIRQAAESKPFPGQWSDAQILKRVRDAERKATRGSAALPSIWNNTGRTDAANARRFGAQFGDVIRWCDPWNKWLVWDDQRWKVDDHRSMDGLLKAYADGLWSVFEAGDRQNDTVYRFVRTTNSATSIRNTGSLARSEPGIAVCPEQFDKDPFALNVANGTLDLRTGQLREHRRDDYLTKLAPVPYIPEAECPTWQSFLDKVFGGDHELIGFIQRLAGYLLTGHTREQAVVFFHGSGANGKSTFVKALLEILGDYGVRAPASLILSKGGGSEHPTVKTTVFGKRLAVINETPEDRELDDANLKEMASPDRITARGMHENYWEFDPTHKLVISTNHKPRIKSTDPGTWRRVCLVLFGQKFWQRDKGETGPPELEADLELPDKLRAEYSGILRWMVEGCMEWQRIGLNYPKSVRIATAQYKAAEDSIAEFLDSCCEQKADAKSGATELLKAYKGHTGDWDMTARKFASLLRGRGFTNERVSGGPERGKSSWRGLSLALAA